MPSYDVIIVGAGPSGSTLAYELASKGIKVLVLEKTVFPRYKCCAGGITVKTAKLLDIDLSEAIEDTVSHVDITFAGDSPYHGSYNQTIMYTVMRDKFDFLLMKRAEDAGAEVLQGVEARQIQFTDTIVDVSTALGNFQSKFIVGADGARSIVARSLGSEKIKHARAIAIETEVAVAERDLEKWKSKIALGLGRVSSGYAWLFPKSAHLSIGIACFVYKMKDLEQRYWEFLNSLNLSRYTITKWSSSFIPIRTGQTLVTHNKAVLLGDAAGLADPLTGVGIYNAILSARLAAPAIEKALLNGEVGLKDYSDSVRGSILPELKTAHVFSKVLAILPQRLFNLFELDERVWKACCQLLRGDIDYHTIKTNVSTLSGLYSLVLRRSPVSTDAWINPANKQL